jgi:nucleotide-binding universal stress UspA family protein
MRDAPGADGMIRRFLVALDGSERAERVFQCAIELADLAGASLHLLRVVAVPPAFPPAGRVLYPDPLPAHLLAQAEAQLGAFARRAPHLHVETIVRDSTQPWKVIIDAADQIRADLIVVGSHGYQGLDYLVGTNAGKVANLARRNVLVVHREPDHPQVDSYRHTTGARRAGRP